MDERQFAEVLREALEIYAEEIGLNYDSASFDDTGIWSPNEGIIASIENSSFQISILKR